MIINNIKSDVICKMDKVLFSMQDNLKKNVMIRINSSLLNNIIVNYNCNKFFLRKIANISILDFRTLIVKPWDKNLVNFIKKSILDSNLGLSVIVKKEDIYVYSPLLTEEKRKRIVVYIKSMGEEARVCIRNIRRDVNNHCKILSKSKKISKDDERYLIRDVVQKLTDLYVSKINKLVEDKKDEILTYRK
ncbi:ribosome-recycling factor [Candidatus Legionella polyplacis]|uniref:Ribosome recycling factor n=1 Tax=Candidatus Legionella polyplacis TaxID=2005262 RepID=A0ABZ2GXV3_9GAMM